MTSRRVMLAGGGTGGHVYPLVALAASLERLGDDVELCFVGTERGLEARVIPERGWRLETLPAEPIKGRSFLGVARGALVATAGVARAFRLLRRFRPRLLVSVGGYAAGPVALAAATLGIPIALLEPNRTTGLTQRVLSPVARRVYVAFPESLPPLGAKGRALGLPIRPGFARRAPRVTTPDDPLRVLVVGGSQGAELLNRVFPEAAARVVDAAPPIALEVVHLSGPGRDAEVRRAYARLATPGRRLSLSAEVIERSDDMPARIAHADLVVARAGGSTLAEVCAVGRPSLLVPYPFAADDHQSANAEALAQAGCAIALPQTRATADTLATELLRLARDPKKLCAMAKAAADRGVPDAADHIANDLMLLAELPLRASHVGAVQSCAEPNCRRGP